MAEQGWIPSEVM
jgi:hypothetical protein